MERNVGRCEATYHTMAGPVVVVERSLCREVGRRNAKVVDPVSLRSGVVEKSWLPRTASTTAHQAQLVTSREAAEATGIRVSLDRVGMPMEEPQPRPVGRPKSSSRPRGSCAPRAASARGGQEPTGPRRDHLRRPHGLRCGAGGGGLLVGSGNGG